LTRVRAICTRYAMLNMVVWSVEDSKRVNIEKVFRRVEKLCRSLSEALEYLAGLLSIAVKRVGLEAVAVDGGCGSGFMTSLLREAGFEGEIVCIDMDPAMAIAAHRLSECSHTLIADLRMIPLRSGLASIIILGSVIHETDVQVLAKELARVCRAPCFLAVLDRVATVLRGVIHRIARRFLHERLRVFEVPHSYESIDRALRVSGFKEVARAVWSRRAIEALMVGLWVLK